MKVAALGRTRMLLEAVGAVHAAGHEVVLIATAAAAPEYAATADDFAALAEELGSAFLDSPVLTDRGVVEAINAAGADVAISVNWPTLVPAEVLDVFPHGAINAHLGDLPRYRGNATPNWAILNGETEVVVTLHLMDAGLDSGPILAQRRIALDETTYVGDIYRFSRHNAPEMFVEVLAGLEDGSLTGVPQSDERPLRCHPRVLEDGWLDWSQDAVSLARLVRASSAPFAGAYTTLDDQRLVVWRAHAEELSGEHVGVPGQVIEIRPESGEVAVLTGDGALVLEKVGVAGGDPEPPAGAVRSTRARLGLHVPTVLAELDERVARLERHIGEIPDS